MIAFVCEWLFPRLRLFPMRNSRERPPRGILAFPETKNRAVTWDHARNWLRNEPKKIPSHLLSMYCFSSDTLGSHSRSVLRPGAKRCLARPEGDLCQSPRKWEFVPIEGAQVFSDITPPLSADLDGMPRPKELLINNLEPVPTFYDEFVHRREARVPWVSKMHLGMCLSVRAPARYSHLFRPAPPGPQASGAPEKGTIA